MLSSLCCAGLENHDSGVGIYAPDAEAYSVFADLFDPIIEDYHGGFKKTDKHPPKDWGDVDTLANLDPAVSINSNVTSIAGSFNVLDFSIV